MPSHLAPGAYKEGTTLLVQPQNASKKDTEGKRQIWKCPCCCKDAVLCKGPKVNPYFRHPSGSDCAFYTGGESAQHYGAKNIARDLLESDRTIQFTRACNRCNKRVIVHTHRRSNRTLAKTEESYQMDGTTYRADVAHFEGDDLTFVWEIWWTHKTSRDAPVPWVDVAAMDVLDVETGGNGPLTFNCIRNSYRCDDCVEIIKEQELEAEKRLQLLKEAQENGLQLFKEAEEKRLQLLKEKTRNILKIKIKMYINGRRTFKEDLLKTNEHLMQLKHKAQAAEAAEAARLARRLNERRQQEEARRQEEEDRKQEEEETRRIEDPKRREEEWNTRVKASLLEAARNALAELVSEHIKNGADVNQISSSYTHRGWTPLMLACIQGSEKVVSLLLEAGAKTDCRAFTGETAAQLAEHYEHPTIVDLINSYSSKAVAKP